MFKIEIINKGIDAPLRAHEGDAGLDLRSTLNTIIPPGDNLLISTGIKVEIPYGYVGLLFSRSGMGKVSVTLANSVGVIDHAYRGEIKVMIQNNGQEYFSILNNDRIAQLVVVPCILDYEIVDKVSETIRGEAGFGSTGKQ